MADHDTRIRWTGRERDIVVSEYQALCASNADLPMLELLVAAQKSLPKERQRPPSYALRAWFNKELKAKLESDARRNPAYGGAVRQIDTGGSATTLTALRGGNGAARASSSARDLDPALQQTLMVALRSALRSPLSGDEMKAMIDAGVEIAVGILGNSRVR